MHYCSSELKGEVLERKLTTIIVEVFTGTETENFSAQQCNVMMVTDCTNVAKIHFLEVVCRKEERVNE